MGPKLRGGVTAVLWKTEIRTKIRELSIDDVANAVVQVEFSPPNPLELELAGVSVEEVEE